MTGALLLGFATLITIVEFLIGLRIVRRADRPVGAAPELDADGNPRPPPPKSAGYSIMLASAVAWLVFAAICFGLLGDLGIEPIVLGGGE